MTLRVEDLLTKASDALHVRRCFGEAIERDGCTIIPVAFVAGGGGGGSGGPPGGEGSGEGGGWGGVSWPLGVYEIRDGRTRFIPSFDGTRIVVSALALLRAVVRHRRSRK